MTDADFGYTPTERNMRTRARSAMSKLTRRRRLQRSRLSLPGCFCEQLERRVLLSGYSLTTLGLFGTNEKGAVPSGSLAVDASGNIYGTTANGGTSGDGVVFEVAAGTGTITPLASFNGRNGADPQTGVIIDSNGNLYGTTKHGGPADIGTVFEVVHDSGTITTLGSFSGPFAPFDTAGASKLVLDGSGNLYGTTYGGGPSNDGTIFEVARGSRAITTLATFNGPNGAYPTSGLVLDGDGNLFGTAYSGGSSNDGVVFELPGGSNTITVLASFNGNNGYDPEGVALDSSGNLFGSTYTSGANGLGNVYEVARNSRTITVLVSFNGTNGASPLGVVMDSTGNLLGATQSGGAHNDGILFEIPRGSTTLTTLAAFDGTNPSFGSFGSVLVDSGGDLYGTAYNGVAAATVFELAQDSGTITTVASFLNGANGSHPGNLVMDGSGDFYGTTSSGGTIGYGTVFELPHDSGAITTLASFSAYHGQTSALTLDGSGNLFGTTEYGGANNDGTLFELAQGSGTITTLVSFNGANGRLPDGGLLLDANGNLFGTTRYGGVNNDGTVFELPHGSATITTLASFNGKNGSFPRGGVVRDSRGDLYGTTGNGGTNDQGTIFEFDPGSATITTLASFDVNTSGAYPQAGLAIDGAGNLYGTALQGGANHDGTVFELLKGADVITTLVSFNGTNGQLPHSGVILDSRGNLYGAAGTIYEIPHGTGTLLTILANGANPDGVLLDNLGNLYGATTYGGDSSGDGTIFELSPDGEALHASGVTINVSAGRPVVNQLVATFTDDDPTGTVGEYVVSLDWGDGDTTVNTRIVPDAIVPGQFDVIGSKSHPYALAGTQGLAVTVIDSGGSSDVADSTANIAPLVNTTFYVDAASPGPTHDGSSWSAAYVDLQQALFTAAPGDQIHIADGTYKPTSGTDRTATFQLKSGVAIYGGYAGYGAANPDERDTAAHPTILSGDIGTQGYQYDNSYHVVTGSSTDDTAVLDGCTVTGGAGWVYQSGLPATYRAGGGMLNVAGSPTINNCVFSGNYSTWGGGIANLASSAPTILHCSFIGNSGGYGGGVYDYSSSSPHLSNCTFSSNTAGDLGSGGGMFDIASCSPELDECTFIGNAADHGGGMSNYDHSSPTLNHCDFTSNFTSGLAGGGGMYNDSSSPTLTDCAFRGNRAGSGGAIANGNNYTPNVPGVSAPTLINCIFSRNVASSGGGMYSNDNSAVPTLINCTFSGNSNGAVYGVNSAAPVLSNSILWDNSSDSAEVSGAVSSSYCDVEGGLPGTGNINADPHFLRNPNPGPDGQWGTADDDYGDLRVQPYSPVADAGNNAAVPAGVTTDFAGSHRFQDVPTTADTGAGTAPIVDIGAYEAVPALTATAGGPYIVLQGAPITLSAMAASDQPGALQYDWDFNGDGVFGDATGQHPVFSSTGALGTIPIALRITDGASHSIISTTTITVLPTVVYVDANATGPEDGLSWAGAFRNLQTALSDVVAGAGQTIRVAEGSYTGFQLKSRVTVEGGYAGLGAADPDARDVMRYPTTILSSGVRADHVDDTILDGFSIIRGIVVVLQGSVTLAHCTITDHHYNSPYFTGAFGGGIYHDGGALTLNDCTISDNSVSSSWGAFGGGIYNTGTLILNGCVVSGNVANGGGGYSLGGGIYNAGTLVANDCTISRNIAGDPTRENDAEGGGIYNGSKTDFSNSDSTATLSLNNCTVSDNAAVVDEDTNDPYYSLGGGLFDDNRSSAAITGCSFVDNSAEFGGGLVHNSVDNPLTINNSIVWGNSGFQWPQLAPWGPVSVTHSDIQGGFAGAGNINADPQFVRNPSPGPDDNWGTADDDYGDLRLQAGSPCIDAGDNTAVPAGVTTDLAGKPRFVDFPGVNDPGAIVDMGAYERGPVGTVRFSTTAISVSESGGAAQVTIARVGGSEGPCSAVLLIGGGTATEGLDYVAPATQAVSFADGEVTKTISIPILEDRLFEGDETVGLTLANSAGGAAVATLSQATLTIVDDDHFDGSGRTITLEKKKFSNLVIADFVNTNFSSPASLRAIIDWGDGSASAGTIVFNPAGGGFEVLGTQKYRKKGTYQVRIVITDADGAQLALTGSITVGDEE